jgi:TFIIF-interacting CTD phosphatase-like protein
MPIECNKIINKIDERKCVRHRLYRYHIDSESRKKEVEKVGRSGDRTVLIDAS